MALGALALKAPIFVSSTCKDMELYRRQVEDALWKKANLPCFLSEDWAGGYDDTVTKCKDKVKDSSGFLLLLGYYYGWVPNGQAKSITHLEFQWATERWKSSPYPSMAVLAPRPDSQAETELRAEAAKHIPQDEAELESHNKRLEAFHSEVLDSGRTAQFYSHLQELRETALVCCLLWGGNTPLLAAQSGTRTPNRNALTDEQLGILGRDEQVSAIADIYADFELANIARVEPVVAILISGDAEAGQRAFMCSLAAGSFPEQLQCIAACRPTKPGYPPVDRYSVSVLRHWVAKSLGLSAKVDPEKPESLVNAIAEELRNQPLCLMLDRVHLLSGQLTIFVNDFWRPLREGLLEEHLRRPFDHRMIAFIGEYDTKAENRELFVARPGQPDYYSLPVEIPQLAKLSNTQIMRWMEKMKVPNSPAGNRARLAQLALEDTVPEQSGVPLRVYEKLRGMDLWPTS